MGVTSAGRLERPAIWIAPAVLVLGSAALLFAALHPWSGRSAFEFGLLYTLWHYDLALPLVGLGLIMAQVRPRLAGLGGAMFAGGLVLGGSLENAVIAATASDGSFFRHILLLAPGCCVVTGATLVSPGAARPWLLPVVAFLVGIVLGLEVKLSDPSVGEWFAGGAALSGAWFIAAPLLLWRAFARGWFSIAGRILGSWMIAIGAMLGGPYLIPPPEAPAPAATEAPAPLQPPIGEPPPIVSPPDSGPLGLPDQVY